MVKENLRKRSAQAKIFVVVKSLFLGLLIATLEILSKREGVDGDHFLEAVLLLSQTALSTFVGFQYLPKIIGNDELRQYQETVLSAVTSVLMVSNKESVSFAFSDAFQRIIGKIDSEFIRESIETRHENVESFFKVSQETGAINTSPLRARISNLIEQGPDPIQLGSETIPRSESGVETELPVPGQENPQALEEEKPKETEE